MMQKVLITFNISCFYCKNAINSLNFIKKFPKVLSFKLKSREKTKTKPTICHKITALLYI